MERERTGHDTAAISVSPASGRIRLRSISVTAGCLIAFGVAAIPRMSAEAVVPAAHAASIYVSPSGKDSNSGTEADPIRTLQRAQRMVRATDAKMAGNITILLESGTYRLTRTLAFDHRDSGTNGHTVVWTAAPGATPVISGARRITGWQLSDSGKNIWEAPLPAGLSTRQMYVNGVRATPAAGLANMSLTRTSTGYQTGSSAMDTWRNPAGIRFVYMGGSGKMTEPSCPVASISGQTITMAEPCWQNSNQRPYNAVGNGSLTPSRPTYIENAYELLQSPGQFYLDLQAHELYYIPRAGEDLSIADVEVPALQLLVTGAGNVNNPVHNISFTGIQFSFATWMQPSTRVGFSEVQANFTITKTPTQGVCHLQGLRGTCPYGDWTKEPGAVQFDYDQHISFLGDQFLHLGGAGLNLDNGSQKDQVKACVFTDISGSGLEIGDVNMPLAKANSQTTGVTIEDNHVYAIGVEYNGGVAIDVGYAANSLISHNQIDNIPYAAISIGWGGWPDKVNEPPVRNFSHNNIVSDNLIFEYMQDLSDGGAVYTQGITGTSLSNGEKVTGNVVHDQIGWSEAMKSDDGATYVTYEKNVLYSDTYDWGAYHADTSGDGRKWDAGVVKNNYWQQGYPSVTTNGVRASGNTMITGPEQAPAGIVASAGIAPGFASVLQWRPIGGPLPYPPEAPVAMYLTGGQAFVTWRPSPDLAGLPVASYTVTPCVWPSGAQTCTPQPANAVTMDNSAYQSLGYVTIPAPGNASYSFIVTANNANGSSTVSIPSTPLRASTAAQSAVPDAPQSPAASGLRGAARLWWYPPKSATCTLSDTVWCSQPILYYMVSIAGGLTFDVSGVSQIFTSNHGARVLYIVNGLTPGQTYNMSVTAVTPAGTGPPLAFDPVTPTN